MDKKNKVKRIILLEPVIAQYRNDFFRSLYRQLKKEGIELLIITGQNRSTKVINEVINPDYKVEYIKTISINFFGFFLKWQIGLIPKIIKYKADSVIIHYISGNINYNVLLLFLLIRNKKYILWTSSWERQDLKGLKLLMKTKVKSFFTKMSYAYITYDTRKAKQLMASGYSEKKIFIAQNTINVEKIIKNINPVNKGYEITRFLFVGALIKQKKLDIAIDIFNILNKKGYNFHFTIIGEGEVKKDIEKQILEYDLQSKISVLGAKYGKELSNYFNNSNVFLLPGTGGLAVNEAMAYGLPIISTPADGTLYDLVENNVNGFLLEWNYDKKELMEKIIFFINADINKIKKMEKNSLKIIQDKALLSNMVNQFVNAIKSLFDAN